VNKYPISILFKRFKIYKKIEEVLNTLAEVFFSIFSRGCKQSNFSTQYDGKGIDFYNCFFKKAGFLIFQRCIYKADKFVFNI